MGVRSVRLPEAEPFLPLPFITVTGDPTDAPPVQKGRFDPTLADSRDSQKVATHSRCQ